MLDAEWVLYKEQYTAMMAGHHTDIGLYVPVHRPDTVLEDARDYMGQQGDYEYLPGKKIATSYIWGVLASKVYGRDLIECLNDPSLLATDAGMILYEDIPEMYDSLMESHDPVDLQWMSEGWCPYTAFYFWAECTLEGSAVLESHFINDALDEFTPENYIEVISHLWEDLSCQSIS